MKRLILLAVLLLAPSAPAALRLPAPPEDGRHVVDLADVITPEDEEAIEAIAQQLWADQQTHLVVAAIDSMAQYGGARMRIEDFAAALYERWRIGAAASAQPEENLGILLLVSRLDQKARIELGTGWGSSKDADSWRLMQDHLVPAFKEDDFSSGLAFGASALSDMARGQEMPRMRLTRDRKLALGAGGVLLLWTLVSLLRSGSRGMAWGFWALIFGILWVVVRTVFSILLTPSRRRYGWGHSHSSGSSWSSGGGGGGSSSSGGGATGSW